MTLPLGSPADPKVDEYSSAPIMLDVYGIPQPQGNKTGYVVKGRAVLVEGRRGPARANFKSWRDGVAHAASEWIATHGQPLPLDVPVAVSIVFYLPRPKSAPKRVTWPATRPDVEKCARAVLDAITGVLIVDDARVCDLQCRKVFAVERPPGCTITVKEL